MLVVSGSEDPLVPLPNACLPAHGIPGAKLYVAEGEGHLLLFDSSSAALAPIRDFLSAEPLKKSPIWRVAVHPTRADVNRAIAAHGLGGQPSGLLNAAFRWAARSENPRAHR
jgi:hypothetical protein